MANNKEIKNERLENEAWECDRLESIEERFTLIMLSVKCQLSTPKIHQLIRIEFK